MATTGRIHAGHAAWAPSATDLPTGNRHYLGKHRKPETWRILSLFRFFYVGRHRAN
jgi:hypothetical protein